MTHDRRDELVNAFFHHRLNRRQLAQRAAALGLSPSALASLAATADRPALAAEPGVLQIGRGTEVTPVWLPLHASNETQEQVIDLIFSRLLKTDEQNKLIPDAAESYEVSPDATVFTYHLRKGITWHDGQPLTASDVIFTYKLAMTKAATATQYGKLSQIKGAAAYHDGTATGVPGLEMPDDYTVRITLEKPNVAFMIGSEISNALVYILPEHIFKDADPAKLEQHPSIQKPTVGSGPYQFVEYVPDQYVSFKANPTFYLGAPKIPQVFIVLAEPATQLAQLESGQLHLMLRVTPNDAQRLKTSTTIDIASEPSAGIFQTAIFNPKFPDKRVRQAFMYGVDRASLLKAVLLGQGQIVNSSIIGPEWAVYTDLNQYAYDPAKAKQLLQDAKWDTSKDVEMIWSQGFQEAELSGPVFQQQMAEIGVKIKLSPLESAAFVQRVVTKPDFDLASFGGGQYRLDPDVSSTYYQSANWTPNGGNSTHYANKDLDALFLQGRGTTDVAKRTDLYHQATKIINEDVPTLFWWSDNEIFGISKRLQGVKPGPSSYIWWNIHEWTLS